MTGIASNIAKLPVFTRKLMPRGGPKADANTRSGSHSGGDHVTTSSDDGGAEAGVGPNAPTSRP